MRKHGGSVLYPQAFKTHDNYGDSINVRDAIEAFAGVFGRVMIAVRVAAGITLLAGALVLRH